MQKYKIKWVSIFTHSNKELIIQAKHPERYHIPVGKFNVIFDNKGIINILYLTFSFATPTYFKCVLFYLEIRSRRGCHLVFNSHLVEEKCFPDIPNIGLSLS